MMAVYTLPWFSLPLFLYINTGSGLLFISMLTIFSGFTVYSIYQKLILRIFGIFMFTVSLIYAPIILYVLNNLEKKLEYIFYVFVACIIHMICNHIYYFDTHGRLNLERSIYTSLKLFPNKIVHANSESETEIEDDTGYNDQDL